ncbi:PREDICTED: pro-MCH [Chrysochloris asiatica]|uniref:Pro-MCH n=1 Tax=Chrysochloris asiatica TaxID=185453 RepID=A0A9B0TVH5_CHRAS|nr:PREDICTED: pro-MCH [Chrysochloris asiatica]
MAKMSLSSYILILTFSLFSQGILLSAKSIRNLEDDMVFNTFRLGKAFQKEDTAEKSIIVPALEQYKSEESSLMNEEENRNSKNAGSKHNFVNHGLPLNLAIKPYVALKGSVAENGIQNTESTQEKREIGDEENSAKFPIGRRDFDMLRCMLGRVYRPCWQV